MKKNGSIVTEMMYRLNIAQKDEKQKQKKAFFQLVEDKKEELQQQQDALILKTIDEISKRQNVMQMKVSCPPYSFVDCMFPVLMFQNTDKEI